MASIYRDNCINKRSWCENYRYQSFNYFLLTLGLRYYSPTRKSRYLPHQKFIASVYLCRCRAKDILYWTLTLSKKITPKNETILSWKSSHVPKRTWRNSFSLVIFMREVRFSVGVFFSFLSSIRVIVYTKEFCEKWWFCTYSVLDRFQNTRKFKRILNVSF